MAVPPTPHPPVAAASRRYVLLNARMSRAAAAAATSSATRRHPPSLQVNHSSPRHLHQAPRPPPSPPPSLFHLHQTFSFAPVEPGERSEKCGQSCAESKAAFFFLIFFIFCGSLVRSFRRESFRQLGFCRVGGFFWGGGLFDYFMKDT